MRTKALLLTAALGVAGAATSMAQVYSVNAVGYINLTVQPGFNLLANQLITSNPSLDSILASPPPGTTIYKLTNPGGYQIRTFDPDDLVWLPNGTLTLEPGEGAFIFNPSSAFTWTLVGEVPTGNPLVVQLPLGFSMISSKVPQAGNMTDLGLVGQPGYTVYRFNNNGVTSGYQISTYDPDDLTWLPSDPTVTVGQAFLLSNPVGATTWQRNFSL